MRLVIDIQKEMYEQIIDENGIDTMLIPFRDIILNGIPLPQNHGDLKDMDDIYEALEGWNDDTGWIVDAIDFQTETIVKADDGEVKE